VSYLYRCTRKYKSGPFKGQRCWQRHSFKHKIEWYKKPKICHSCKNEITYIDNWAMKKNKENMCDCGNPHFPHRAGSSVWCVQHPTGPTEEDYKNEYG